MQPALPQLPLVYRDHKRYYWLLSLFIPALAAGGPLGYLASGNPLWLWFPVLLSYGIFPWLDLLLGQDISNPPESEVPRLEADAYYRYVTYALVPLLWAGYIAGIWFFCTQPMPLHGQLAGILTCGAIGGYAINLGHELGHKKSRLERILARVILAMTFYGHFYVEHNRGHHRDVATPEDPASSRMGESIYRFMLREMPGAWLRAWGLERERLGKLGLSVWSWRNEILPPLLLSIAVYAGLCWWLGWQALPFMLGAAFWSNFQLSSANYVEHYGLLRQKLSNGKYEICTPSHSWNSNQVFSNWAVLHLQRHADHHAHPSRRYQSLRHFEQAPQLPNGYFGMFVLAYVPPLWFKVMNPRLVKLTEGRANRINFDPARRAELVRKYGLVE